MVSCAIATFARGSGAAGWKASIGLAEATLPGYTFVGRGELGSPTQSWRGLAVASIWYLVIMVRWAPPGLTDARVRFSIQNVFFAASASTTATRLEISS